MAAFGFLGSNPGAITVQGSQLSVTPGQSISLVGGNITVQSGVPDEGSLVQPARLSAPGGQINIASVASPGEILLSNLQSAPNINGQSFTAMGNISLVEGAILDVSANAAGTVRIRGGQLIITEATISADTGNTNGAQTAVDIQLTGDLSIANDFNPAITARTTGSGDTGQVSIVSSNMTVSTNAPTLITLIDTHTEGTGKGGDVSITTGNLLVTGSPDSTFIDSGFYGPGHGGDVTFNTQNVQIDHSLISTGNFWANADIPATGDAGNVNISTGSLNLTFSQISTIAFAFTNGTGRSGNISFTAHDVNLVSSLLSASGHQRGGTITINTDHLFATASSIATQSNLTSGGAITVTGKAIDLKGSIIASSTGGDGNGGSITITATDHLGLLGSTGSDAPSGLFSNSFGSFGTQGNGGDVVVTTPRLDMTGGSRINTTTGTSGHGGNVTINTTGPITMSGETAIFPPEPLFSLGVTQPSGIFTRTKAMSISEGPPIGANCSGPCGNAGNISINTGSLSMGTGSQIDSGTRGSGQGGNITITARDTIAMSGTLSTGQPGGIQSRSTGVDPDAGAGGNISLIAGKSVSISNGASVSASTTGPGNAGNILLKANDITLSGGGTITAASTGAGNAGTVTIQGLNSPANSFLVDGAGSGVFTNTEDTGAGGNVSINADTVTISNGGTLSAKTSGSATSAVGGTITVDAPNTVSMTNNATITASSTGLGNILITTNLLLPDSTSLISASSQFGQQGTIIIQSPISPASGKIVPLGQKPLLPTSLLSQRCAALAGGNASSFTVAGRDALPVEPGGWLSTPLALTTGELVGSTTTEPETRTSLRESKEAMPVVSLRRIAPPGFLTQNFAADGTTGCTS